MTSETARAAALTLGGLRGHFACVHGYVGREKVAGAGKMRKENGNKHSPSTHCVLDTFYVICD